MDAGSARWLALANGPLVGMTQSLEMACALELALSWAPAISMIICQASLLDHEKRVEQSRAEASHLPAMSEFS